MGQYIYWGRCLDVHKQKDGDVTWCGHVIATPTRSVQHWLESFDEKDWRFCLKCRRALIRAGQFTPEPLAQGHLHGPAPVIAEVVPVADHGPGGHVLDPGAFRRQPGGTVPLVRKYRPESLAEIIGQDQVVAALTSFVANPYSAAMIFHGESGVGKTSAARVLATELGCCLEDEEIGGFLEIASGEMTADAVRAKVDLLRYRPLSGSGWKVVVANEADRMMRPAETIWLDVLEHLPPRTVIVFTTNEIGRLSQRFRDRCEVYKFAHEVQEIGPWITALVRRVLEQEVGDGEPPRLLELGMPTVGDLDTMHASFRLALQQLQPLVRAAQAARVRVNDDNQQRCDDAMPEMQPAV